MSGTEKFMKWRHLQQISALLFGNPDNFSLAAEPNQYSSKVFSQVAPLTGIAGSLEARLAQSLASTVVDTISAAGTSYDVWIQQDHSEMIDEQGQSCDNTKTDNAQHPVSATVTRTTTCRNEIPIAPTANSRLAATGTHSQAALQEALQSAALSAAIRRRVTLPPFDQHYDDKQPTTAYQAQEEDEEIDLQHRWCNTEVDNSMLAREEFGTLPGPEYPTWDVGVWQAIAQRGEDLYDVQAIMNCHPRVPIYRFSDNGHGQTYEVSLSSALGLETESLAHAEQPREPSKLSVCVRRGSTERIDRFCT